MCGIAGFIDFNQNSTEQQLREMTDMLYHRGPNSAGYQCLELSTASLGLGHRRLAILDLSEAGHQPMSFNDKVIIYNGEVYNYKSIRSELEAISYTFESNSDTEVILKAFDAWGIKSVERFNGMFAFAIADLKQEQVFIFRDRTGVKPLYYYYHNGTFLFASELKSFHQHPAFQKQLSRSALVLYLQYSYVPAPYTIFENTHKLEPGHYLQFDVQKNEYQVQKYWDIYDFYNQPKLDIPESEVLSQLESLLTSAFNYRMTSDVPVGVFLSGGYDSSAVAALIQQQQTTKLKTYTIGFEFEAFNEAKYAEQVANHLGTEQSTYYCTTKETQALIPNLPFYFDEPFGDRSAIPTMLVSQFARNEVTVALSADGGDEVFAGYQKYEDLLRTIQRFSKIPKSMQPTLGQLMQWTSPMLVPIGKKVKSRFEHNYHTLTNVLREGTSSSAFLKHNAPRITLHSLAKIMDIPALGRTNFDSGSALNNQNESLCKLMAIDYKTFLVDDVLMKIDRAGMSVSLEGREPLLDYRIAEFAARIPASMKMKNGIKKYLLKEIVHKHLPKALMDRPKMGFDIPLVHWFRNELKSYFIKYFEKDYIEQQGLFNYNALISIRDDYFAGRNDHFSFLWNVLMFQMWYETWMQGKDPRLEAKKYHSASNFVFQ